MTLRAMPGRSLRFLKLIYLKLVRINDSPQRIAFGFGLGVFMGVIPGTGPIAAFLLALALKVNRASALAGSIFTNTWLSVPVFFLAIKTGSFVTGSSYENIYREWLIFLNDFKWAKLFHISAYNFVAPVGIGYLVVSLCVGIMAYAAAFVVAEQAKNRKLMRGRRN